MLAALARVIVDDLRKALAQRGQASLLLSGGSTPAPLYQALSAAELDWRNIHVALVDERWVDTDHEASNERLIRRSLLQGPASEAHFLGMKNGAESPQQGAAECDRNYAALPEPYTLCLLGMGPDGHTASLFPAAQGLDDALSSKRYCAAIRARPSAVTGDFVDRMTMTPAAILRSERLVLLITGEEKWTVLQAAYASGDTTLTPVSYFTRQARPLEVYWAA